MAKDTPDYAPDILIAREHVEINGSGKLQLKSEGLKNIMERHGATAEVVRTYDTALEHVYGAAGTVLGEHLIEKIKEAQAAGEDASGLVVHMALPTKNGSTDLTAEAQRTFQNRMGGEGAPETVTRYGRMGVRIQTKRRMPKEVSETLASVCEDLLGGGGKKKAAPAKEEKIALPT